MLVLAIMTSLSFAACGGGDDDDPIIPDPVVSPIVGTWEERFDHGTYIEVNIFYFYESGKGKHVYREEDYKGFGISEDPRTFSYVFKESDSKISLKFDDSGTLFNGTADITGNTLILQIADTYYSCTRK